MKRLGVLLASLFLLSCAGDTPAPTSPNAVRTPGSPSPPAYAPFAVSGTVRDDTGAPVVSADVFAGCLSCKTGPGFSTKTDENGRYSGNLPAGTWGAIVRKAGFTTARIYDLVVTADTTRDITLKPGVILSGRTFEEGVGALSGVRIEVLTGPSAGVSETTNPPGVGNAYSLSVLPGEVRLRASKEGYDPVERVVNAVADTYGLDFTLKWSYGSCLRSVTPVVFNGYPSAGGEATVIIDAFPDRDWTAAADQPWLSILSPAANDGPGSVTFRVLPHPAGAEDARTGAIMIRCGATAGQNVWVVQNPDCQITLTPDASTPAEFPSSGGSGRLRVVTGLARCKWKAEPQADWISTVGVSSWYTSLDNLHFTVAENRTGAPRTGILMVGETAWVVRQR